MRIPIFLSCPTVLNATQDSARAVILGELRKLDLEPRALGRSDYPTEYPLREVMLVARHCSGGVVLGFEQFRATAGIWKPNTKELRKINSAIGFPTEWNNLEAGILFSLRLPLLIFKEPHISGGVFDSGVSDVFVHKMPMPPLSISEKKAVRDVFLKWQARVREHYYGPSQD